LDVIYDTVKRYHTQHLEREDAPVNAKKETGLVKYEPKELLTAEQKVHEAEQEFTETFYHIGKALEPIREKELWRQADFKNWGAYCKAGRIDYTQQHANALIKAATIRHLLPELPQAEDQSSTWGIAAVEQLCRLPLDTDIKRASKKIATRVKRGDRLSRALAKEIVDAEMGVESKQRKAKARQLAASDTPADTLNKTIEWAELLFSSMKELEETFWTDAEEDSPGIVKRLTRALSALVSLVRSRP